MRSPAVRWAVSTIQKFSAIQMDFPVKNAVSHQFDDGSLCDILDRRTYVHEEEGRESLIGLDGLARGPRPLSIVKWNNTPGNSRKAENLVACQSAWGRTSHASERGIRLLVGWGHCVNCRQFRSHWKIERGMEEGRSIDKPPRRLLGLFLRHQLLNLSSSSVLHFLSL